LGEGDRRGEEKGRGLGVEGVLLFFCMGKGGGKGGVFRFLAIIGSILMWRGGNIDLWEGEMEGGHLWCARKNCLGFCGLEGRKRKIVSFRKGRK